MPFVMVVAVDVVASVAAGVDLGFGFACLQLVVAPPAASLSFLSDMTPTPSPSISEVSDRNGTIWWALVPGTIRGPGHQTKLFMEERLLHTIMLTKPNGPR